MFKINTRSVLIGLCAGLSSLGLLSLHAVPSTADVPATSIGTLTADGTALDNAYLRFAVDAAANKLTVNDKRTGRLWQASLDSVAGQSDTTRWQQINNPVYRKFTLQQSEATEAGGIRMTLLDEAADLEYFLDASLTDNVLSFEVHSSDMGRPLSCVGLPPMFTTELEDGYLLFSDRSSGVFKSQTDPYGYAGWILSTYGNTNCLDMPWVGIVDRAKGDGVMVLLETPLSSAMHLRQTPSGIWPQPLWQGSMGMMHFTRRVSYRFSDSGGYVALAEMYRDYQRPRGKMKTLAEKAAERPNVSRLAGSPMMWGGDGSRNVFEFLSEVRPLGVTRATFCNAEREGMTAADMKKLNQMGYLTLRYDSYSDILEGATGFQLDDIEKTAMMLQPGGELAKGWQTLEGLQYYFRSSAHAMNAARAYSEELVFGMGFNAHFIDVIAAMDLTEDYHPNHTFARSQDMRHKREVLNFYTDRGLVLGTEHGNDWAVDLVDFTEGALSGSLWWTAGSNRDGWNPGHLQAPKSRDDFSTLYQKFGIDMRNRIPLWQLVYNDCVVSTWYWGDSPGWFYEVAPEITLQKDLTALLYGALTLFWRDDFRGYGWPKHKERFMASYHLTTHFQRAVFGEPMTSHAFVSDDRLVQRTRFGNGGDAWVNFGAEAVTVDTVEGRVTLAPYGFHATAPGLRQGRVLQGDAEVTYVVAEDILYLDSAVTHPHGGLSYAGKLVLFPLEEGRWNLLLTPASGSNGLVLSELAATIGTQRFAVFELTEEGETGARVRTDRLLSAGSYAIVLQE